ncbi:HdeA/HdeB family chaperone [Hyphomicrobium sp.]|uniref:HdeA/HdeB family chaperone n=1 Tax=Hyphomicrobium sp. TaxID=82 RepID=UPI0025C6E170|nr:HdeA/HdeB family chaperone [Hyphomicrobium sp.]
MLRIVLSAITTAFLLACAIPSASAEQLDASTLSCRELTEKAASSNKSAVYGASVILYWMEGYQATEDQGTVVDFDNVAKEFEATTDFCSKNPGVGVMSATAKFMGENAEDATPKAIDLSILKCEAVNSTKENETEGLGQILMWLAGYHASVAKSTIIDMDKFGASVEKITTYCVEHPEMGLFTASEKFMGEGSDSDE